MPNFSIEVSPADDLIDVPRRIIVRGAHPGEPVRISSATVRNGAQWRSTACYIADAYGHVDVSMNPAIDGDYYGIDPMGLLWSQKPVQGRAPRQLPRRCHGTAGDHADRVVAGSAWPGAVRAGQHGAGAAAGRRR
jgi:hypothetical protein